MDRNEDFSSAFLAEVGLPLLRNVPLAPLSSFKIGGPADFLFESRAEAELKSAVALAVGKNFPFYVIGGGTNLLFDDAGYRGLIIKNSARGVVLREGRLEALSGTDLSQVLAEALAGGAAGLEFLAGIPGTVGGALFSNAGAFGQCIGDHFERAVILGAGGAERSAPGEEFDFGYRRSSLQKSREIVLRAVLMAPPGDRKLSESKVREYMEKRRSRHPPWGTACAGSYFKNPCSPDGKRVPAGLLLEQAGARGRSVGGAAVYQGHCNFIVNRGNAGSADVLGLARELKTRVLEKFGILLEEEVIHLEESASML